MATKYITIQPYVAEERVPLVMLATLPQVECFLASSVHGGPISIPERAQELLQLGIANHWSVALAMAAKEVQR
jgi:hypothetical protein